MTGNTANTANTMFTPSRTAARIACILSALRRHRSAAAHCAAPCPGRTATITRWLYALAFSAATVILFLLPLSTTAGETQWQKFNRILDKFDTFDQDSVFIARPATRWIISFQPKLVTSEITMKGKDPFGKKLDYDIESKEAESFSLYASYRCLSASFTINPSHQSDVEWDFDLYGDAVGGEIIYHKARSFSGEYNDDTTPEEIDLGAVRQRYLLINGYYVLNHKQFSFPAAFYHQTIQKKSCGSLIFGVNYYDGRIKIKDTEQHPIARHGIRGIHTRYGGLCVGYAHNWVPHRRWILHLSVLPTWICWRNNYIRYQETGKEKIPRRPLDLLLVSRFAATYSWSRYFTGCNFVYTLSELGSESKLRLQNIEGKCRMFIGIRF